MLDVRRYMLVMRMRAPQSRIIGMRLRIVPVQFLLITPDLVAVLVNNGRQTMVQDTLADDQPDSVIET
ncbi:MAG: hypothetical protein CVU38_06060 [Chloroflexi bacterium HGW-Chloroflexi-1]|nr:MAG: hypothetical protein CVU38_06060 [Chloroflexi bacterium HGW-Chloroflexi-1]